MTYSGMGYDRKMLDKLKRQLFLKVELKNFLTSTLMKNKMGIYGIRYVLFWKKITIKRFARKVQIRNRCVYSGRVWNTNKKTQYGRFIFLQEAYKGNIPGLRRFSW